ncbi:MAG: penicillin-binding protein 1C [Deltaproteobacteria bacterium]|jgi:penicillin-binding protein 1C|nr:penicillin-binding protein 1C [Deltaproteobacteria bacterium]
MFFFSSQSRFRKKPCFYGLFLAAAFFSTLLGYFWLALGLLPDPLGNISQWDYTVRITDRSGRVLREVLPPPMNRRHMIELDNFSPILIEAILAAEDKRFFYHLGVDPLAMLRAVKLNLFSWSIKSGGSTLTMQVARLSAGLAPGPKTISRKLREIWRALLIERHHTKEEILTFYLNTAPAGSINLGFEAAAQSYLGKSARFLSSAEAAFLASLPAAPLPGRPQRLTPRTMARREMIIRRLSKRGVITPDAAARALNEPLVLREPKRDFKAPHFIEKILNHLGPLPDPVITSTLDYALQEKIELLAESTVQRFHNQGLNQVAVVVLSLPKREVLAYVGSADFFGPSDGQIDGVTTLRQPGSALKPFIYALGLESGAITAATLLEDSTTDFPAEQGLYKPRNYSGASHGPVSARLALASSLNLPAINLTLHLGLDKILQRLRDLGLDSLRQDSDYYGLGLALGGGEVSLLSLTTAYAALADGGKLRQPVFLLSDNLSDNTQSAGEINSLASKVASRVASRVMSEEAAYIVEDILSDQSARITGFGWGGTLATPYRAAVKTGTSKNYRDNWCLGYTSDYVIGVWAGNFQAQPMANISGITGTGQLWRSTADLLVKNKPPKIRPIPPGVTTGKFCPISGLPAGPNCPNVITELIIKNLPQGPSCPHDHNDQNNLASASIIGRSLDFDLISPKSGEIFAFDPGIPVKYQKFMALVQSSPKNDEIVILVDGSEFYRRKVSGASKISVPIPFVRGQMTLTALGLWQGREIDRKRSVIEIR